MAVETNSDNRFHFQHVSVPVVKKHLKELKRKKSDGIDQIPACLLKDCAHELAPSIAHLINTILKTSIIPTGFKIGKVTPIYKSGDKNLFDNYRPITVLPIISKIVEKCVYQELTEYLESNNLLSKQQFGFRKGRSTETATTLFLDDIHKAMDKSQLTGAIFIDLSKAFDTISHSSILEKLPSYGIGREKAFFTDYLFNRWQRVSYKSILSSSKPIFCGVPQGAILGPLLFLLHFNNAEKQLEKWKIIMYADDTLIYYQHKDIASIEKGAI